MDSSKFKKIFVFENINTFYPLDFKYLNVSRMNTSLLEASITFSIEFILYSYSAFNTFSASFNFILNYFESYCKPPSSKSLDLFVLIFELINLSVDSDS